MKTYNILDLTNDGYFDYNHLRSYDVIFSTKSKKELRNKIRGIRKVVSDSYDARKGNKRYTIGCYLFNFVVAEFENDNLVAARLPHFYL